MLQTGINSKFKQKKQRGFSLFELLVVMSLAALAISTMLTYYKPGTSSVDIRSIAVTMTSRVTYARNIAIQTQKERLVSVDLAKKIVSFGDRIKKIRLKKNIDIKITSASIENRNGTSAGIRFFPNGSSTGGIIELKQGKLSYEIRVNWLTGRVSTHKKEALET